MAEADIPVLVKHMALAIYESGDIPGPKLQVIQRSLLIARHRLVQYGFLLPGSEVGGTENIRMTGKGLQRNAVHIRELGSKGTTKRWDQLYELIAEEEGADEDIDGDGSMTPGVLPVASSVRAVRDEQRRVRQAKAARTGPRTKRRRPRRVKRARRR